MTYIENLGYDSLLIWVVLSSLLKLFVFLPDLNSGYNIWNDVCIQSILVTEKLGIKEQALGYIFLLWDFYVVEHYAVNSCMNNSFLCRWISNYYIMCWLQIGASTMPAEYQYEVPLCSPFCVCFNFWTFYLQLQASQLMLSICESTRWNKIIETLSMIVLDL